MDRGGKRLVGRSIETDLGNNGKEDYVLEAHFLARERVTELPLDVAIGVIGRNGIRAMRPQDLKGAQQG